jgi:membrane-associated phospholipid phosphatase
MDQQDMLMTYGVDKFSFPSGHASRAVAVAFFFLWLYPLHPVLSLPVLAWSLATAASR